MKRYIGTKIVQAEPAWRITSARGTDVVPMTQTPVLTERATVEEGYMVKYPDGYVSWSPKDAFEEAYRETGGMSFGLAIEAMKKGARIARRGWNGKGMFLFLADAIDFRTWADLSCVSHLNGSLTMPSIVMKTADDHFCVGWLASQGDMLADDWYILEN